MARGLPVFTSYGLTEMASQVTTTRPGAGAAERETSGRLLPHRLLRIAADGEILVRGETRFRGYVDEAMLHEPFDAEGWYATGDLGRLGEDSLLRVEGRKDNLFISGGENVQPEEIESALAACEGVAQAVVVPVPDAEFGYRPVAFVRLEGRVPEEDLRRALERRLPRFKMPRVFLPWPEEYAEGLKPDRRRLRELASRLLSGNRC